MIFVSGGPGNGKSSLAYNTLARIADDQQIVPILIRLLDFKWDDAGLELALQQYMARHYPYLPDVPWAEGLADILSNKTILLILDGLDELSKALGPRGQTHARVLVAALKEFLDQRNPRAQLQNTVLKAIVLGRIAAIQELSAWKDGAS
jgi:NACHT domain